MNSKKIITYSAYLLLASICVFSAIQANWLSDLIDVVGCAFGDCPESSQKVHNVQKSLVTCANITPQARDLYHKIKDDREKALQMKGSTSSTAPDKTPADVAAFNKEMDRLYALNHSIIRENIVVKGEICTGFKPPAPTGLMSYCFLPKNLFEEGYLSSRIRSGSFRGEEEMCAGCLHTIKVPGSCGSEALNNACLIATHDNSAPEQLTPVSCALIDPRIAVTTSGGTITCLMTPENKAELQKRADMYTALLAQDKAKLATNSASYTPAQHAQIQSIIDKLVRSIAASKMERPLPYPQRCAWDTEDVRIAQSGKALNACLITSEDQKPIQLKPLTCTSNSADL